jgi:hypothetical protein
VALNNGAKCDLDVVKANFEVALIFKTIFVEKIEKLKQQIRYKRKTWLQTQGKLQATKVDYLFCDAKVYECEEMYVNSMKGFKLTQKLMANLVKQLVRMKVGSSPYFHPLLISRPPPKSSCSKNSNVEACLVCDENFDFNDISVTFCSHTYHPWYLLVHTTSSRKCKATNREGIFHELEFFIWIVYNYG